MTDITVIFNFKKSPIKLDIVTKINGQVTCSNVLDTSLNQRVINISFNKPLSASIIGLDFQCTDQIISEYPITISEIILDDFYNHKKLTYTKIDNGDYNNTIYNTQKLTYNFKWPFFREQFFND